MKFCVGVLICWSGGFWGTRKWWWRSVEQKGIYFLINWLIRYICKLKKTWMCKVIKFFELVIRSEYDLVGKEEAGEEWWWVGIKWIAAF